jgi:hypothetical protein
VRASVPGSSARARRVEHRETEREQGSREGQKQENWDGQHLNMVVSTLQMRLLQSSKREKVQGGWVWVWVCVLSDACAAHASSPNCCTRIPLPASAFISIDWHACAE